MIVCGLRVPAPGPRVRGVAVAAHLPEAEIVAGAKVEGTGQLRALPTLLFGQDAGGGAPARHGVPSRVSARSTSSRMRSGRRRLVVYPSPHSIQTLTADGRTPARSARVRNPTPSQRMSSLVPAVTHEKSRVTATRGSSRNSRRLSRRGFWTSPATLRSHPCRSTRGMTPRSRRGKRVVGGWAGGGGGGGPG